MDIHVGIDLAIRDVLIPPVSSFALSMWHWHSMSLNFSFSRFQFIFSSALILYLHLTQEQQLSTTKLYNKSGKYKRKFSYPFAQPYSFKQLVLWGTTNWCRHTAYLTCVCKQDKTNKMLRYTLTWFDLLTTNSRHNKI